jgi:lipopolysaccharide export system protein LptC
MCMLTVLGILVMFVAGGPSKRVPALSVSLLPQAPDAALHEFSFVQSKDGVLDWKLHAKHAQVFEAESKAVLSDVQVTLTNAEGVSVTVDGDEGTINTASKDFALSQRAGMLSLVLQDGYTIYTPRISWVNGEHRFWTDEPVRITGPHVDITGEGMDAMLSSREMRIRRNVRVEVY